MMHQVVRYVGIPLKDIMTSVHVPLGLSQLIDPLELYDMIFIIGSILLAKCGLI